MPPTAISFLDNLDEDQLTVVEGANGIVRVLARAGSGKTRTLTARIEYLVRKKHVPYWRILALTFSNRAADEIGARLGKVLGNKGTPRIGTFHSLAYEIVKEEFPDLKDYEIDDSDRYKTIVKDAMYGKQGIRWPAADDRTIAVHEVCTFIEYAKNFLLEAGSDECLRAAAERPYFKEHGHEARASAAYQRAEEIRHEKKLLTFDDMIFLAATTLRDNLKIREKWAKKYDYVLCDESQDTSQAQHLIAESIAERRKNLFLCGDDFQSIYGWRFADREILSSKEFSGKTFTLPRNYRSGKNIVELANRIFPGMKAMRDFDGDVNFIENWSFAEEAKAIVEDIAQRIAHGTPPGSIAILYRCRWLSGLFEDLLHEKEIPFRTVGSTSFFERKESRDILAWMRVAVGSESNEDLRRTLLAPTLYLKRDALTEAVTRFREEGFRWQPESTKLRGWLGRLSEVKSRRSLSTAGLVDAIFKVTGYAEFLKQDGEEDVFDARADGIQRFADIAARWDEPKDFLSFVRRASNPERKKDAVWLSTVYIAKGREWPHVYVAGLAGGIFPHWRSVEEEERRLFYVAMTRAQDSLTLSGVEVFDEKTNKVKYPISPYFDELRPIEKAEK